MTLEREIGENYVTPAELIQADEGMQKALDIKVEPEFRLGIRISIFNATMRKLREEKGLTQVELSLKLRARGVSYSKQTAGQIERFQYFPNEELAAAIADELNTTSEALFPSWFSGWLKLQQRRGRTIMIEEPVTPERINFLQGKRQGGYYALPAPREQDPEKIISQELLEDELAEITSSLTDIQKKVIIWRFWEDLTLEQIGQKIGRTGEAVRLIEARALRRMRHPKFSKRLRGFLKE